MTASGNGIAGRIVVGVAIIIAGALATQAIYNSSRITAVEVEVRGIRDWLALTRSDIQNNRTENNVAHDRIMAEIKDQSKAQDARLTEILTEILKEMKK